ncbi:MAG: hypothetical protein HQL26_09745 [Candidatus Omnitrophica bacterium]|nr:hypothetical protein [Candidatus Omnitrophota bacterium]
MKIIGGLNKTDRYFLRVYRLLNDAAKLEADLYSLRGPGKKFIESNPSGVKNFSTAIKKIHVDVQAAIYFLSPLKPFKEKQISFEIT